MSGPSRSDPAPDPAPRVGVREVARAAGVSTQTVSRVLNGHPHIRPETRDRVLEAIAALGYRVNNAARALGTRSTRTLGVLASDAAMFGPSAGIVALDAAARARGRWIATAYADASDPDAVAEAAERLLSQGVDGIVVLVPHAGTLDVVARAAATVPVAAMHTGPGARSQADAAALAAAHLVGRGHRAIAHLAGPAHWLEAAAREAGVTAAIAAAQLPAPPVWRGDWSAAGAAALAPRIAAAVRVGEATAIAVANDQMALGLIAGVRAEGLSVPGDLSVTGFDDTPDAAFYQPALTTVRLDVAGEARRTVAQVLGDPEPPPAAPPILRVRASTAAPSA